MVKNVKFLNPQKKLIDEVVDWLCGSDKYESKIRTTPENAKSLSHILVVVPTAQSARNLRFALARRADSEGACGILPPIIAMANTLLLPEDVRIATEAEELAAMAEVLRECEIEKYKDLFPKPPTERTADWALDIAGMLLGIEKVLGESDFLMEDVKTSIDGKRWADLAAIEELFIESLQSKGICARVSARRNTIAKGCCIEGVEEIVLPSSVDIKNAFIKYLENSNQSVSILIHAGKDEESKFDEWGRPVGVFRAEIDAQMIDSAPNAVIEADDIAKHFRAVESEDALPALVVCDSEMYPELEGAFQNYFSNEELVLRNPSKEKVSGSPLGRLLESIIQLSSDGEYEVFSSFVRTGDVARWAQNALNVSAGEIATFVGALDAVQNAHLPQTIDDVITGAESQSIEAFRESEKLAALGLKRLAKEIKAEIEHPYQFLKKIFSSIVLNEKNAGDRELVAAAEVLRSLHQECLSPAIPECLRRKIFSRLLKNASYMLEPTAENVLVTLGWLEVQWCLDDEVVVSGFNEGCVPENVVGHPFIPDSLRKELGVTTNAMRESRDSFIFARMLSCRQKGTVSIHLHQIAGDKNVMKPSRILFNGIKDDELPSLALRLYAVTKGNEGSPAKSLPSAWRLKLPVPPQGEEFRPKLSPTFLDQYLRCPFTFYLKEIFGERSDDRNQELDALAFGNLCHSALDKFAKSELKDSTDAKEIAAFLANEVRIQLQAFGMNLPAIIELQGEAAITRLEAFSVHQAERRKAGWRIIEAEQTFSCAIKGCKTVLRGKVDRIDQHEVTGDLVIIDYKTWNQAKEENYNSIQLPVYRAMVESSGKYDPVKAHASKAMYCILAERPEDVKFDEEHIWHEGNQSESEDKIVALLTNLAKGIFYPPNKNPSGGGMVWEKDFSSLIWESPEKGLDPDWIEDQKARLEANV
jgi:ATP-dependent helicase/nuclease subunit B